MSIGEKSLEDQTESAEAQSESMDKREEGASGDLRKDVRGNERMTGTFDDGSKKEACGTGSVGEIASEENQDEKEEGWSGKNLLSSGSKKVAFIIAGVLTVLLIVVILFATHVICFHQAWVDASCEEPKHCVDCGKAEGEPLGHEWIDATCSEPATCMRCGATDGEVLGHQLGEPQPGGINFIDATRETVRKCVRCDKTVDSDEESLDTFIEGDGLLLTAEGFAKRLDSEMDGLTGTDVSVSDAVTSDGELAYGLLEDGYKKVGVVMMTDATGNNVPPSAKNDSIHGALILVDGAKDADSAIATKVLVSLVMTVDPSLSLEEAKEVAKAAADGETVHGGIRYVCLTYQGDSFIRAMVE